MDNKNFGNNAIRTAALALCTFAMGAIPAMAQDNTAPPPPSDQQQGQGGHRDPAQMEARHLEMMTKQLSLTPDQVTQVKTIDDAQQSQMTALRQDTSTPQQDKRSKMMAIRQDTQAKIRAILTDEQKPKYDAMLAREKERMEHRGGGESGPPSAPPSAQ